jgi:uncharacterized protein (TIGR02246 family)
MQRTFLGLLVIGATVAFPSFAANAAEPSADEAAIRAADDAYVQAYNRHDAKALANAWSPEAVYLNRSTGTEVVGRGAIADQFAAYFNDEPDVKLAVRIESIQFVSPNVAVEHGVATTESKKSGKEEVSYNAVFVRRDGQWLLDRVTEKATEEIPSHAEQLKPLEWMIGRWVDKDDNVDITTDCQWTKNKNFITRSFAVVAEGKINLSGMQVIGWDPSAKTIRSWTFDSDGGFTEGTWTLKKDRWYIRNKGVLADGRKASMVNVIRQVDQNSFTWQTIERTAGGELLPNINEVVIVRE